MFINEIVSEVALSQHPEHQAQGPVPSGLGSLRPEELEELVERVAEAVLERLAQHWRE
ncbi:hypothetical protein [Engelhardtia mirabilis]|uniref:Uncharacterized protein n=1 Tax=Engelhardtia mirabilis TaxID=2528011 RepID=A0A518BPQ2_9BACT|nr:hypothetical protein Pla133_40510 [Planctomycetes bacterium Pla133]QDV03263.1 hypothetical protein Pla86_40500 [Planctomycetes bacterium Pla86]